ncbi:MAG TPA: neuraminidase-like domain-containing protein, partial [Vicinamibacterales bacterium]|nr:neuraminidase-like domain-containing protein [Vicinamibacterales bacterium]
MSASRARTLRGFLAERDTGAGLAGLRVELWATNGRGPTLIASGRSDDAGVFRVRVPAAPNGHDFSGAEWRVFDRETLLLNQARPLPPDDRDEPIDLTIASPLGDTGQSGATAVPYELVGRVRGAVRGRPTVRAVLKTLHNRTIEEEIVGEAPVNSTGWYRIVFERPAGVLESIDASLSVRLYSSDGTCLVESTSVLVRQRRFRIDVRPPRRRDGPSEFALLESRVAGALESGAEALDGAESDVVRQVSEWLDVDPERLEMYQQARTLGDRTGVPPAAFYALARSGAGCDLDGLLDVSSAELKTTLQEAAAEGIVDGEGLGSVETLVEHLSGRIVDHVMQRSGGDGSPGLREVLAAASIPHETIESTLRSYRARAGSVAEFWESFGAAESGAEAAGESDGSEVQTAVRTAALVGVDPPLLERLHAMRREGRWRAPDDLSDLTFDDWCELIEQEPGEEGEAEDEDAQELIEARAEAILDRLEDAYPSRFIFNELSEAEEIGPAAHKVLKRTRGHDFWHDSMAERAAREPSVLEGLDSREAEAAIEEISAIERVARFAGTAREVRVLVGTGKLSAMSVAAESPKQFAHVYAEALGGRPQAARVHAQAQQVAAATKLIAVRLLQALQQGPFVLGAPPPDIKDVANLKSLFQSAGGFCDCEHCGSVYSPAAYFVDLLRYLNVSSPERLKQIRDRFNDKSPQRASVFEKLTHFQPLDVLLGRRPDLADLPLTCENTLTPLPYIDLVNELLEAFVTGGSAAFDTGKTPADVLRAVPQHLSREAYERLRQAVHPLTLPYHQPLSLARAYLAHLGVSRLELLRTLGRGDTLRPAVIAESLGMSPDGLAFVTQTPPELWRHFGFEGPEVNGQPLAATLAHVPAFLAATGITFQNLIDLVSTRFLNADDRLRLETPTADCNPDVIRFEGLDEARIGGMVRLIRLQRRLGWSWTDLDRALIAFGARDLDAAVLEKLATAQDVAKRLDRPLRELLVLWAPLDTWGADNQYDKLFTTRAVTWRTQDERTFQLRPDRRDLSEIGDSLDPVASALLAAMRITSEELALIRALHTRRGAVPKLDLAGLSALHRVVVLARALQLRIGALDLLLRLTPPEADPFKPGDPEATRRFIDIVRDVQASDFTPERLAYIFRHEAEPRRDPGPLPAQVDAVLATIRRGLADAYSETSRPAEATGDTLRQKLAVLFDPALLDQAMDVLDPRTAATPARRREFFDRHLARLFPDPAAASVRLFGPAPTAPSPSTPPAAASSTSPAPASTPPPQEAAPAPPVSPLEARLRANVDFVLEYLLPILRARQLRGAVIQTLSDTLGVTAPAIARLLERILRSRTKAGEPLIRDFLALLGTGLTGAYFANADLGGQPVLTRVDPDLTFSWSSAAPAEGVPARRFSARWTGHLLPKAKAAHIFYIQTDGAVRLTIKSGDAERAVIDQPAPPPGRPAEHASDPIELEANRLYEIRLEYRNHGEPATLAVQAGTSPAAKQPLPTPSLYPADGLSSFAPVEESYRRLHKASLLLAGFGVTDRQLEWLTGDPAYLNLDALPMQAGSDAAAIPMFREWRQLAGLYALRKRLPHSNTDLFDVFTTSTMPEAIDRLVLATGWEREVVEAFLGPDGMAVDAPAALRPSPESGEELLILRLAAAVDVQRRAGVAPPTLYAWANSVPDADAAASIVQAVKARYDETRWLEVARTLNDPLRQERRDALVAYLLPRMRHLGVTNRNQLFEYFLIDVDMNPCMLTSRIRQATGAVQTFFQRCLMNLEPRVPPRIIDDNDWRFLKNYRVFEAAKKVFLYPENWIEPDLRDDKSPLFQTLESTILQQEIKRENVEAAFADYLEGLDEVSRLDVRGVWFEKREPHRMARALPNVLRFMPQVPEEISKWEDGTYHVFARTFNAPHVWYYRRLENGRAWTAWEKLDVDIEGEHLVPVIFNRRMHLFWAMFKEANKPVPELNRDQKGPPPQVGKDWEIQLAYSVYDRGKWSRKRMSSGGVVDVQTFVTIGRTENETKYEGSRGLSPSDYTLRASVVPTDPPALQVSLYCRATDILHPGALRLLHSAVDHVATFTVNGCNGALVPDRDRAHSRARVAPLPNQPLYLNASPAFHAALGTTGAHHAPTHPFR